MNYLTLLPSCLRQYFYSNYLAVPKELNVFWSLLPALASCEQNIDDYYGSYEFVVEYFVAHGYLKVLIWARQRCWPFEKSLNTIACRENQAETLRWLCETVKLPLSSTLMCVTTQNGHLEILQYLIAQGCPIYKQALIAAVEFNHIHILQWVHDVQPVKQVGRRFILPAGYDKCTYDLTDTHDPSGLTFAPENNLGRTAVYHENTKIVLWLLQHEYYTYTEAILTAVYNEKRTLLQQLFKVDASYKQIARDFAVLHHPYMLHWINSV